MNDSGVLISAYQGTNEVSLKAILILNDVNRQFMTSSFVQLEVLSKAIYHQQTTEIEFYETFLRVYNHNNWCKGIMNYSQ